MKEEIEKAFERKSEALIRLVREKEELARAELAKEEKKIEIAKNDISARESGALERLLIRGKNEKEREQCELVLFEEEDAAIRIAKDRLRLAEMNYMLAALDVEKIDFILRNDGK